MSENQSPNQHPQGSSRTPGPDASGPGATQQLPQFQPTAQQPPVPPQAGYAAGQPYAASGGSPSGAGAAPAAPSLGAPAGPIPPTTYEPAPSATAPAVRQPRWSGKKTAVAAALAIGLASAGAITAAAAIPQGSSLGGGTGGMGGPGGHMGGPGGQMGRMGGPGGQMGQPGQMGQMGQLPGGVPGGSMGQAPGIQQGTSGTTGSGSTT